MLTDAQVAAQAFDFRAETRLGVAPEAFALVGALEVQDGRAGNAFAEALAMNMLEVEANLLLSFRALASRAKLFGRSRRNSDRGGFPAAQCYSAKSRGLGRPAERGNTPPAALATSTVRREVCA